MNEHYTIVDEFGKFLLQVSGVKEKTKHQYSRYVQNFLCEKFNHFSEKQLAELAPIDVIEYMMNQKKFITFQPSKQ